MLSIGVSIRRTVSFLSRFHWAATPCRADSHKPSERSGVLLSNDNRDVSETLMAETLQKQHQDS